jgi:predicted nucleotidyltransferase
LRDVNLPRLTCLRCGYTWTPVRSPVVRCSRCKSRYWDVPRIRPVRLGKGLGIEEIVLPHRAAILGLARRYGAKELRVFGSVRRREATAHSDVDLLVEWRRPVSLLSYAGLRSGLEEILGRRVDLANRGGLHPAIAPRIEAEAVPL